MFGWNKKPEKSEIAVQLEVLEAKVEKLETLYRSLKGYVYKKIYGSESILDDDGLIKDRKINKSEEQSTLGLPKLGIDY